MHNSGYIFLGILGLQIIDYASIANNPSFLWFGYLFLWVDANGRGYASMISWMLLLHPRQGLLGLSEPMSASLASASSAAEMSNSDLN